MNAFEITDPELLALLASLRFETRVNYIVVRELQVKFDRIAKPMQINVGWVQHLWSKTQILSDRRNA